MHTLSFQCRVLGKEAVCTIIKVIGSPGLEPMTYHAQDEHSTNQPMVILGPICESIYKA